MSCLILIRHHDCNGFVVVSACLPSRACQHLDCSITVVCLSWVRRGSELGAFMSVEYRRLGAFVGAVCGTLAPFERPYLQLEGPRGAERAGLIVWSPSAHRVRSVEVLARGAGLDVQPMTNVLICPVLVVRVPVAPALVGTGPVWASCCAECGEPGALRVFNDRPICRVCFGSAYRYARLHLTAEERGEPWPTFDALPVFVDGGRV